MVKLARFPGSLDPEDSTEEMRAKFIAEVQRSKRADFTVQVPLLSVRGATVKAAETATLGRPLVAKRFESKSVTCGVCGKRYNDKGDCPRRCDS